MSDIYKQKWRRSRSLSSIQKWTSDFNTKMDDIVRRAGLTAWLLPPLHRNNDYTVEFRLKSTANDFIVREIAPDHLCSCTTTLEDVVKVEPLPPPPAPPPLSSDSTTSTTTSTTSTTTNKRALDTTPPPPTALPPTKRHRTSEPPVESTAENLVACLGGDHSYIHTMRALSATALATAPPPPALVLPPHLCTTKESRRFIHHTVGLLYPLLVTTV